MDAIILVDRLEVLNRRFFQVSVPARVANELFLLGVKKTTLVVDAEPQSARMIIEKELLAGVELAVERPPAGVSLAQHAVSLARPGVATAVFPPNCMFSKAFYKGLVSLGQPESACEPAVRMVPENAPGSLPCSVLLLRPPGAGEPLQSLEAASLPARSLAGAWVSPEVHDEKTVQRFLIDGLRKTVDSDGVVAFYLMRPITLRLTRILARTPILPNHVTIVSFLIGMAGVALVAFGDRWLAALGGLLFFVATTTDCIDGEIARLRYKMSYLGGWLDTFTDDIQTSSCILACGIYASRHGMGEIWLGLGAAAAALFVLPQIYVYFDIHRRYHSSDTVDFKFAWEKPSVAPSTEAPSSPAGLLKYAFKRDFFTLLFALLIALEAQIVLVSVNLAANLTRAVMVGISAVMVLGKRESA